MVIVRKFTATKDDIGIYKGSLKELNLVCGAIPGVIKMYNFKKKS